MNETSDTGQLAALGARLDALESRQAIVDLASDYCHGFDKRDFERFLSIWWQDCTWDIGPPFGVFEGHEGVRRAVKEVLWPAWDESHHFSTNHSIRFRDADHASAVCDVDCVGRLSGEADAQIVGATYEDEVERRDGVWGILRRTVTIHYFNPLNGTPLVAPG